MSTEEQLSQIKGFNSVKSFYQSNRKNVSYAGIAIILVAAGIYYYSNFYKPARESKAHAALFSAERYFRLDSTEKALYGDGINLGVIDVADQYGNTKAGNLAKFYAGRLLLSKGEYEQAKEILKGASFSDNYLAAASVILLGDCYTELGDYPKAAKTYLKAAKKRDNNVTAPRALFKAALAFEASQDYKSGIKAINSLREKYYNSINDDEVKRLLARLEAREYGKDN